MIHQVAEAVVRLVVVLRFLHLDVLGLDDHGVGGGARGLPGLGARVRHRRL